MPFAGKIGVPVAAFLTAAAMIYGNGLYQQRKRR